MRNKKSTAAHPEMYEIQLDNQQSEQKFLTKNEKQPPRTEWKTELKLAIAAWVFTKEEYLNWYIRENGSNSKNAAWNAERDAYLIFFFEFNVDVITLPIACGCEKSPALFFHWNHDCLFVFIYAALPSPLIWTTEFHVPTDRFRSFQFWASSKQRKSLKSKSDVENYEMWHTVTWIKLDE